MSGVGKCPLCGKLIAYIFPIHDCPKAQPGSINYVEHPKRRHPKGQPAFPPVPTDHSDLLGRVTVPARDEATS